MISSALSVKFEMSSGSMPYTSSHFVREHLEITVQKFSERQNVVLINGNLSAEER